MRARKGPLTFLTLALCAGACAFVASRRPAPPPAEEALLTRRVEGLRQLLARASQGSLVDFDEVLVVVHQDVVRDLLRATTPYDETIAERYHVQVTSASAEFSDGFALVRLEARAEMVGQPASAEVSILGALEVLGLEETGLLRCQVRVFAVEAREANVAGLDESVRDLIEDLGRDGLNALLSVIDVPVRVEDRVHLPAVETKRVSIPAAEVPFSAKVVEVRVFAERLWVGLSASVGGDAAARSAP
jgi:hypothetical protein